jgi:hypothetical protein
MSNDNKITSAYIHEKSNVVPEWVKKLDDLKKQIRSDIHATSNRNDSGIKYLHPLDVPGSPKR